MWDKNTAYISTIGTEATKRRIPIKILLFLAIV